MFLLDEPTTGLASADIRQLLRVLARLVAEGNTLVVIEHNLEFIAHADYVIDLGPGGGDEGGRLVAAGAPLKVAAAARSQTGRRVAAAIRTAGQRTGGRGAVGQAACAARDDATDRESYRGAMRIGFTDIVVIAIVLAMLLFAAWKQFPAYNRPFKPRRV